MASTNERIKINGLKDDTIELLHNLNEHLKVGGIGDTEARLALNGLGGEFNPGKRIFAPINGFKTQKEASDSVGYL